MLKARAAALVLLDASPFYRFSEAQLLPHLAAYLRDNALITPEVSAELQRGARAKDRVGLRYLQLAGWPHESEALPPHLQREFLDYSRAARHKDDPPSRHAGEISTVLMAAHLGGGVVIDDLFGKRLARDRGVARLSTAQLAAEMVVEDALTVEEGFRAFDVSTPDSAGREDFERACMKARSSGD